MRIIRSIKEFRQQMEIPFDNKHPIHDKPIHIHIKDALISLKTKTSPDKYRSTFKVSNLFKENLNGAINMFINDNYMDHCPITHYFISNNSPFEYSELWKDDFNKEIQEVYSDYDEHIIYKNKYNFWSNIISSYDDIRDLKYNLSQKGNKVFKDYITEIIEDNDFYRNIQSNDGLVTIYRAISFNREYKKDVYENILCYDGVGVYWSWDFNSAEPYSGDYNLETTYTLHAKVKPEYINWVSTIYKNNYSLNNEREIELNKGEEILILGLHSWKNKKFIKIDPVVVRI